jgi:hypothetical protein
MFGAIAGLFVLASPLPKPDNLASLAGFHDGDQQTVPIDLLQI